MTRNPSLDALRGIAVLAVICCHYPYFPWMGHGTIGVDLFFVLSGFLISGLLFSELIKAGSINYGRFLIRRGFKIYPPLYVFLALSAISFHAVRKDIVVASLFLQNYIDLTGVGWGHLWSLAVEEHFYFCLPFVLLALVRLRRLHFVPQVSLALIVVCFLLRWQYCREGHYLQVVPTHLRCDSLFAGVGLGFLYHYKPVVFAQFRRWPIALLALPLLVPALLPQRSPLQVTATLTANLVAFSLIVAWAVPLKLNVPIISELGKYSYSIYLWQQPLSTWFKASSHFGFAGFAIYVVLCFAIGVTMSVIVEMPALALRDRIFELAMKRPLNIRMWLRLASG